MMRILDEMGSNPSLIGKELSHEGKTYSIAKIDNFEYKDPIDGSIAKKQVNY